MKIILSILFVFIFAFAAFGQSNCTYSIAPTYSAGNIPSDGGTQTVSVMTQVGCAWTAVSNSDWIGITSGASGTGNGTVGFTIAPNSGAGRSGTLTIAGNTYSLWQTGPPCTYSVNAEWLPAAGGPISITKSNPGCIIEQRNQESVTWIQNAIAQANSGPARGGIIKFNVGPTVGQRGGPGVGVLIGSAWQASGCAYSLSANSASFSSTASNGLFDMHTNTNCTWTITPQVDWITINLNQNANGNGTVGYLLAENPSGAARTGTINAQGQIFTVNQSGAAKTRKRIRMF